MVFLLLYDSFKGEHQIMITPVEVVITTRAVRGNNIIMSNSSIYYINAGESSNYIDTATQKRIFEVTN